MKKLILVVCGVLFSFYVAYGQKNENPFFSQADLNNIVSSSLTPWGETIVDTMKAHVAERLKHPMAVPTQEAGHSHDYFCPVHNVLFEFDWDKPHEQYCPFCQKTWSSERIDWAWITILQDKNKQFLTDCMWVYLATGEREYARYIKEMLLDYADKYPHYKLHDKGRNTPEPADYSAKMFAQSLDESVWFSDVCRAYSAVKPMLSKSEVKKIEDDLLREGADLLLHRGGGGNWQVWNNSGLAAIGVALNDKNIVRVAVENAKVGYKQMMKTSVNRDGWWNEGSPNYHFYPLRAMLLTADAVRSVGYDLFDEQLEMMFVGPIKSIYNDLSFPSHNDGWYGVSLPAQINLYETAYSRYRNPVLLHTLQACYKVEDRLSPEALLTNTTIEENEPTKESDSYLFGQTGYGVLRDGKNTVVLKYGPSGGGHGHPDKLSITIHNGEKEIVPDLGTCAYGIPDYLNWYKRTLSHNTVTVDCKDQRPATGQIVHFDNNSIEAFCDKAYQGVEMKRLLELNAGILADEFRCTSDSVHNYDYVILLTEQPRIDKNSVVAELNDDVPYGVIRNVRSYTADKSFTVYTGSAEITFQVDSQSAFELFVGEAPGIPPTNPDIATKTGTERRPVADCYPLIIRVKGKNMAVKTHWRLF